MASSPDTNLQIDAAREQLRTVFGFGEFRGRQTDVLARILEGHSTLAVMPTGAGKSLTYQLPATMLRGTCIVISPLIALMHDQLRSASEDLPKTLVGKLDRKALRAEVQ